MADKESTLRLRLTANNEAGPIFKELGNVMESVSRVFSEACTAMAASMQSTEKGFQSEAEVATRSTRSIGEAFSSLETTISSVTMAVRKQTEEVTTAIRSMETGTTSGMKNMNDAISDGGLLVGLQMVGDSMKHIGEMGEHLFVEAVKQSAEFEQSLSDAKTAMVIMGKSMEDANDLTEQLKHNALEMGSLYHRSATEIGEAYATLVRNGVDAKYVVEGVGEATVATSMLTKSSAEETAAVMSDIFNEYSTQFKRNGKSMQDNFQDVTKGVIGALYSARVSMGQFMNTMQYVGNGAATAGMQFSDLAIAIAEMAKHGEVGSKAGTALNMMMTRIVKPTRDAADALQALGLATVENLDKSGKHFKVYNQLIDESTGKIIPFEQLHEKLHDAFAKLTPVQQEMYSNMLFGQQHFQKLLGLINDAPEEVQHMQDSFSKIDIHQAMKTNLDNLQGDLMLLEANWDTLLKTWGDSIHGVLRPLAESLDEIVKSAQSFSEAHPQITKFGMAILGIGSVATIAGGALLGLLSTIGFLKMGLNGLSELNPFTLISRSAKEATVAVESLSVAEGVAGGAGAAGGIASVFTKIGTAMKKVMFAPWIAGLNGIKSAMKGIAAFFEAPLVSIGKIGELLMKPFTLANIGLAKGLQAFGTFLNGFFGVVQGIILKIVSLFTLEGAMAALTSAAGVIRTVLTAMMGPWGILAAVIMAAIGAIIANWDSIKSWAQQHFGGTIPMTWEGLKTKAESIWNSIKTIFTTVWDAIKNAVTAAWDYISPTIMNALTALSTFWNQNWTIIKEFLVEVWHVMAVILAPAVALLGTIITAAIGFIAGAWKDAWNAIKDALKLIWDLIADVIRVAFDVVTGIFTIALDILTGHWGDAWTRMKQMLSDLWGDIKKLFGDFITDALNFGTDMVKAVADGITSAIHFVIDAAKSVVSSITSIFSSAPKSPNVGGGGGGSSNSDQSAEVDGSVGGSMSDVSGTYTSDGGFIPAMATGGLVTGPTYAVVGEGNEPEVVSPLSAFTNTILPRIADSFAMNGYKGKGGGNTVNINVTVNGAGKDGNRIGLDIASALRQQYSFTL